MRFIKKNNNRNEKNKGVVKMESNRSYFFDPFYNYPPEYPYYYPYGVSSPNYTGVFIIVIIILLLIIGFGFYAYYK